MTSYHDLIPPDCCTVRCAHSGTSSPRRRTTKTSSTNPTGGHCLCLAFPLPSWLRHRLCLAVRRDPITLFAEGMVGQFTFIDGNDVLVDPHVLSTPVLADLDGCLGRHCSSVSLLSLLLWQDLSPSVACAALLWSSMAFPFDRLTSVRRCASRQGRWDGDAADGLVLL